MNLRNRYTRLQSLSVENMVKFSKRFVVIWHIRQGHLEELKVISTETIKIFKGSARHE